MGHVVCSAALGRASQPTSPPYPPGPSSLIKLTLVVSSMWLCVRQPAPLLQLCSSALVPTDVPLHIILG